MASLLELVDKVKKGLQQTQLAKIAYQRDPNNLGNQINRAVPQISRTFRERYADPLKGLAIGMTGFNPLVQATRPQQAKQFVSQVKPLEGGLAAIGAAFPAATATYQGAFPAAKGILKDIVQKKPFTPISSAAQGIKDQPYLSDVFGIKNQGVKKALDFGETALSFSRLDPEQALAGKAGSAIKGFIGKNLRFPSKKVLTPDGVKIVERISDEFNMKKDLSFGNFQDATELLSKVTGKTLDEIDNLGLTPQQMIQELLRHANLSDEVVSRGSFPAMGLIGGKRALKYADSTKFSSILDKKPRFEIDDSRAEIKLSGIYEVIGKKIRQAELDGNFREIERLVNTVDGSLKAGQTKLSEILDHKELYKNYPQLKNLIIKTDPLKEVGTAHFTSNSNQITLSPKAFTDKSILLHEIQHAIQQIEGFARGGNPYQLDDYMRLSGELEARAVQRRMNMPSRKDAVFHGTPYDFNTFDLKKSGTNTDTGMWGQGIYFTNDFDYAKSYKRGRGRVIESTLNLKNPYIIRKKSDIPKIETPNKTLEDLENSAKNYSKQFTEHLKAKGHDGVIVTLGYPKGKAEYVVFDPEKINMNPKFREDIDPYAAEAMATTGTTNPNDFITRFDGGEAMSTVAKDAPVIVKSPTNPDSIIDSAKKQIGAIEEKTTKLPFKQELKKQFDNLYTQWVDRYHPIEVATKAAKKMGEIATKNDPTYLVRRLTGAGSIADATFRRELNPILKQMEGLNISKSDMDVYLKARRDIGLAQRGIKGSDEIKAQQVIDAVKSKYGDSVDTISNQLYQYQEKYFKELVDSGFISQDAAKKIREQNPDYVPFERIMDDDIGDYLGLPTRKTQQGTQVIQKIKGSDRKILSPIESIIANTFKHRAAIEKNRVANSIIGLQEVAPSLGFEKVAKSADDTITVWKNGNKEFWKVGKDIADTAKGVNEENMNMVLKVLQAPASLLRQGATGRNPEFMIPNIIKDQFDAGIASRYGYIPFVDWISGLKSMLKNDEIFKQWEMSGAKIDLGEISGRKSIAKLFNEKTEKKKLSSWLRDGLDFLGKYSEQPTRVGLFKKAYQKTKDPLVAMMESRDSTVDFSRMGSKMKVANSIVPFLNVGIQGFDKLIRSVKNNPGKVAFNMALYGSTPTIATTIYNLSNHPEEYAEVPEYVKETNFVLISGRNPDGTVKYVTIPKGNILPVISNPIESLLAYTYGQDQRSFGEFATKFISSTLPVIGEGSTVKEVATKTIGSNLPQAIKPITENLLNKSFFKYNEKDQQSKEIVPFYLKDKPAYEQKYDFTPQAYQKIGAALNVSPLQVQNILEGYLAGYVKFPSQIIDILTNVSKGGEISTNQVPILRRFISSTYPVSGNVKEKETPKVPPLMERLTGKASAAEETDLPTNEKDLRILLDQANSTIRNARKNRIKLESADNPDKFKLKELQTKVADAVSRKKDIESRYGDLDVKEFLSKKPELILTGDKYLDAKIKTNYRSALTKRKNKIIKLIQDKKISLTEGKRLINEIDNDKVLPIKKTSGSGGKKKGAAITIKKATPAKISFSAMRQRQAPSLNLKKLPKLKSLRLAKKKKKPILKID